MKPLRRRLADLPCINTKIRDLNVPFHIGWRISVGWRISDKIVMEIRWNVTMFPLSETLKDELEGTIRDETPN